MNHWVSQGHWYDHGFGTICLNFNRQWFPLSQNLSVANGSVIKCGVLCASLPSMTDYWQSQCCAGFRKVIMVLRSWLEQLCWCSRTAFHSSSPNPLTLRYILSSLPQCSLDVRGGAVLFMLRKCTNVLSACGWTVTYFQGLAFIAIHWKNGPLWVKWWASLLLFCYVYVVCVINIGI